MQRAGRAVAAAVLRDFEEIGGFPTDGRILVLVGKGHNGGDALLAAAAILEKYPAAQATVLFAFGERSLRPLAAQARSSRSRSPYTPRTSCSWTRRTARRPVSRSLESMAVAGLLTEIEERLGILIEDDEVDGEMLETYGSLVRFAAAKTPR